MMRRTFLGLAAATLLCAPAFAQQPIKIGFIGELSGPQGALGQDQYDAFMLVVERNGGRLGGVPVQVLREDTQLKPEVANQVIDKLIERERVPIIAGVTFSNIFMTVYKKVVDSQVFILSSNAGPSPIAGAQCKANVFSLAWQNDGAAEAMGKFAQDRKLKRVYLMAPNYQAGKDMLAGFKRYYKGEVDEEVYTQVNQPDYSAEIAQLQAAAPEALFVFYPGGMGINFVKQLSQAGLTGKIPLYSVFTVDGTTLPSLREAAVGTVSGAMYDAALDVPENKKFVAAFEAKYKRTPSLYAATGYDAAHLLDAAVRKSGNDPKKLAAAVKAAGPEFKSVRGPFRFGKNNMPVQNYYAFETARDGGKLTTRLIGTPLAAHADAYAAQCSLP